MARWKVEEDKNNYLHVREDKNGPFQTKEEAIRYAKSSAKYNKTILRIHNESTGYETSDYTNILLPQEWINKLESEVKINKAEYMISKTKVKDLTTSYNSIKKSDNENEILLRKHRLLDAKNKKRRNKMNYKESKKRLHDAKKNS